MRRHISTSQVKPMFTNILTVTKIMTKYAKRNPWFYFFTVIFIPVSILAPLVLLVDRKYWADIFIGSAVCSTTVMTIPDLSDVISHDRYTNSLSFFITRPIRLVEYIIGMGLGTLFYNLAGVSTILLVGYLFLGFNMTIVQIILFFIIILLGWFISCTIGFTVGMWGPRDPRINVSIGSILAYSFTFLVPVYYPLEALPPFLQKIMYCFYTTHLALIGKNVVRNAPIAAFNIAVVGIYFIVVTFVFLKVLKWKEI